MRCLFRLRRRHDAYFIDAFAAAPAAAYAMTLMPLLPL
jgi:hypothetical protein